MFPKTSATLAIQMQRATVWVIIDSVGSNSNNRPSLWWICMSLLGRVLLCIRSFEKRARCIADLVTETLAMLLREVRGTAHVHKTRLRGSVGAGSSVALAGSAVYARLPPHVSRTQRCEADVSGAHFSFSPCACNPCLICRFERIELSAKLETARRRRGSWACADEECRGESVEVEQSEVGGCDVAHRVVFHDAGAGFENCDARYDTRYGARDPIFR